MAHSVLIVDDEEGIRSSLSSILSEEGYEVEAVRSGEECLTRLGSGHFDVVLLDIWLPKMDGIETLERMRQQGHFPMVVMISGHGNIETAVRATKLGAFDFIEKPLSIEKTMRSVKNAIAPASIPHVNMMRAIQRRAPNFSSSRFDGTSKKK